MMLPVLQRRPYGEMSVREPSKTKQKSDESEMLTIVKVAAVIYSDSNSSLLTRFCLVKRRSISWKLTTIEGYQFTSSPANMGQNNSCDTPASCATAAKWLGRAGSGTGREGERQDLGRQAGRLNLGRSEGEKAGRQADFQAGGSQDRLAWQARSWQAGRQATSVLDPSLLDS